MSGPKLTPVILSGGSGTRLWPLSRPQRPKQFLPLIGNVSLIRQTLGRCLESSLFAPPLLVSGAEHAALIEEELRDAAPFRAILEPCARNTAPAIALAALAAGPDAVLLVMPSDHFVGDVAGFHAAARNAATLAADGRLVTFGIKPAAPETRYGYVKRGAAIDGNGFAVERFVEKPDLGTAEDFLAEGGYYWNGGIFAFRASAYLEALGRFEPSMAAAATAAMDEAESDGAFIRPARNAFARSPSNSIDYSVMERADNIAMVEADMDWSDIGNWNALHEASAKDAAGNSVTGDVLLAECVGTTVHSDGLRVSALGLKDVAIIVSGRDVVVLPRARAEEVKRLCEARRNEEG